MSRDNLSCLSNLNDCMILFSRREWWGSPSAFSSPDHATPVPSAAPHNSCFISFIDLYILGQLDILLVVKGLKLNTVIEAQCAQLKGLGCNPQWGSRPTSHHCRGEQEASSACSWLTSAFVPTCITSPRGGRKETKREHTPNFNPFSKQPHLQARS